MLPYGLDENIAGCTMDRGRWVTRRNQRANRPRAVGKDREGQAWNQRDIEHSPGSRVVDIAKDGQSRHRDADEDMVAADQCLNLVDATRQ